MYVEQFSYWGLTAERRPAAPPGQRHRRRSLAHGPAGGGCRWTTWPPQTGGPVAIVAESEGTLVATAYLEAYPEAPVDRLMLLSPIVDPGRATYPDPGEEGFGVVAGYELRAVTGIIDAMAPFVISADGALTDSVRREAAGVARARRCCDRPAIEEVAVVPLADAVTAPGRGRSPASR